MKRYLAYIILCLLGNITLYAQTSYDNTLQELQKKEELRKANYKQLVTKVLKDDELFVLFYLDLALVVDPTKDSQYVERITTENPWCSIKDYLNGKSNIYFCPSGSQLTKPIEYYQCPIDTAILMSDQYGMYRLSSPKELFENRGESFRASSHKAIVFGGLKYDDKVHDTKNLLAFRGNRGANYHPELQKAYEEAIYVDSILRKNHAEVSLQTNDKGTESTFYQIPGSGADILHIATHGEYTPEEDKLDSKSFTEWMMSHSSLALAGIDCDNIDSKNDGKLTAYEISQTDLSDIKLAVLSTCMSGLGDVRGNEIYGLIKGFKMSGAGTLLTTLAEVNDTAAQIIMNRFYSNIFRGDNPRRALENAQRFLRLYDKGHFNKLEYWTPFILVDDLDRNIGVNLATKDKDKFLSEIVGMEDLYQDDQFIDKWNKAKDYLGKYDAFVRFYTYKTGDDTQYIAFVGNRKNSCIQKVFKQCELPVSLGSSKFSTATIEVMNSLVWKNLQSKLYNANKILVQCADSLTTFPLECTALMGGRMYRVSDVSTIIPSPFQKYPKTASVFGGLEYAEDLRTSDSATTRGPRLGYLWDSKQEAESIYQCLVSNDINSTIYTGRKGTECNFKGLKVCSSNIIHIATHGFYINVSDDSWGKYKKIHGYSIKDYLLGLSGLALSGAEAALNDDQGILLNGGILEGSEIAELNMKSVNVATISSCGGLLGVNTSEDTWSLVKAFKMAGVKTVVTSIDMVEDKSTCKLMTEFYTNWISKKMTKHDALEAAKKAVRETKGWEAPKYWASFVLLDGLD